MDAKKTRLLVRLYADIVKGFTKTSLGKSPLYIRHSSLLEQSELEEVYDRFFESAVKSEVPTEDERKEYLAKTGQWTPANDKEVADAQEFLSGLEKSKRIAYLKKDVDFYNEQISTEREKLSKKLNEKFGLIGTTAESFAKKKMNDYNIYISVFKDFALTQLYFDVNQYEDMELDEFFKIERAYLTSMQLFSERNIKTIGITAFFQNAFYLTEDNAFNFFGKPVTRLTFYQTDLFTYGRFFKRILEENRNLPEDISGDPDKLMDWFTSSSNIKKVVGRATGDAVMVFGAKAADIEALGEVSANESLSSKDGKSIGIESIAKQLGK